ncbi:unnamed protein product [Didymodactylos carnosus]|uniref:Uncharacterized protein n=1 Tax=Didymodactylos carnosus TaxID=1234261 RepID=A0A815DV21_9BILA|nr:unnamed protein product [Didymodactylos carnosus]CAF4117652.1 unnamed protein product [Didymodactylos carnosus]
MADRKQGQQEAFIINCRLMPFSKAFIRLDDLFDYIIPYISTKQIKALTIEDGNQTYFPSQSDLMKWFFSDISTISSRLIHLSLQTSEKYLSIDRLNLMCTKIFHLTNLKYLSLFIENYTIPTFHELELRSYQQSSSIEYLTIINSGFHFSELRLLFAYMPKLKYLDLNLINRATLSSLSIGILDSSRSTNSQKRSFLILQDLKEIKFDFDKNDISIEEIILLLTQITKLEKLTVNIQHRFFIHEILTEILFSASLPLLKTCRVSFIEILDQWFHQYPAWSLLNVFLEQPLINDIYSHLLHHLYFDTEQYPTINIRNKKEFKKWQKLNGDKNLFDIHRSKEDELTNEKYLTRKRQNRQEKCPIINRSKKTIKKY